MTDWKKILETEFTEPERARVKEVMELGNDPEEIHEFYTEFRDAHASFPQSEGEDVTPDHIATFLEWLVHPREVLNRIDTWHDLLGILSPDGDPARLIAIYERETGIPDAEAFPAHLDPGKPEGAAVAAREDAEQAALAERHREQVLQSREAKLRQQVLAAGRLPPKLRGYPRVPVADPSRQSSFDWTGEE